MGMINLETNEDIEQVYKDHGFENRKEYLESLCEQYDADKVQALSFILGPNEDFDGLVNCLEDDEIGL